MLEAETTPTTHRQARNSAVNGDNAHTIIFTDTFADPVAPARSGTDCETPASPVPQAADHRSEASIEHAVFEIAHAARATEVPEANAISMFRQAQAMDILASRQMNDSAVSSAATRRSEDCAGWGAAEPSGSPKEIAAKIAYLVKDLASLRASEDVRSMVDLTPSFVLASCALADLVLMGDRPIDLPASVTTADASQRETTSCQCGAPTAT